MAPQQIVSVTPSGGGAVGGEESSVNDVIITATSCGGGEVVPPPMHAHQVYRYQSYPHTQYYTSPPATVSILYSTAPPPPPHYHSQDLCYSSTVSYPSSYFHHKSYSTPPPPPASYHRRYIPLPQYYSDLYLSPAASNASAANRSQQQSQQMVVTGSGSASSYQPPPPPLVDTYPPPVSIVDPYAGAPAYYGSYGEGPGAAGCYTHSPPTRSFAFIDAAYQSCPCPMQSCPKNVHTGDGKGPLKQEQEQQQLPLELHGALGPPRPARGSAGMPPPPSPASASARNPKQCKEEAEFQQRTWDSATMESQWTLEDMPLVKSKEEPSGQDYVGETQLPASIDVAQDLQLKGDKEMTTLHGEDAISRHGLLTISKDGVCRAKPASIHVPLLMCDYQKKRLSPVTTKSEEMPNLDSDVAANNSVKMEVRNLEKEVLVENKSTGVVQNGSKMIYRNGSSRKRKEVLPGSEVPKIEIEMSVLKRRKLLTSNVVASKINSLNTESQKTIGLCDSDDQLAEAQTKCKTAQKTQPLSSNSCSLHNAKQNARKQKLDDGKELAENKEPLPVAAKKVQRLQTKIYPSRAKPIKKAVASSESLKKIDEILDSIVGGKERTNAKESKDDPATMKKVPGGKIADRKNETKVNGVLLHQKKPLLRHQETSGYANGDSAKARASQTNANHVRTEGKKSQQYRKSDTMPPSEEPCARGKKSRVNYMLRSHGLRDSLSDRSSEEMPILSSDVAANNSVKIEVRNLESEVLVENMSTGVAQNGSNTVFRNGSSRKRKEVLPGSEVPKIGTEMSVPKRRKLSTSNVVASKLSFLNRESQKTIGLCESEDQLAEAQTKCKTTQKTQPLSSNSCSLHNAKQNARKQKLDDDKDLAENKEPLPVAAKKVQRLQTKIYPSRAKPVKKAVASSESLKKIDEILDSVVGGKERTNAIESKNDPATMKKVPGGKIADRKKETKVNGELVHQKKPFLRHQETSGYVNGDSVKARASQTNANRIQTESKKSQQCRKYDTMPPSEEPCASGKMSRVNYMLRSRGLRDFLSDRSSSDNVESHVPRAKVCCSSSAKDNRRMSTGSRKDQPKKPTNMIVPTIAKKQLHVPGAQELGSVALMSYARKPAPRKSLQSPKWSNGWKFEGQPFESRVFTANDDMPVMRRCYALMRHQEGDVIRPRDCVLLKSGPRKTDLPFVAKVAALWENPDDGEMMVSLLWYYRPENTGQGRRAEDMEDEIFASKHKDIKSVACIKDKCYVLTFNEYCRYRKGVRRLKDGIREPVLVVPQHEDYPRDNRQPPGYVAPELVFFCRRVYNYKTRRMLKNPR